MTASIRLFNGTTHSINHSIQELLEEHDGPCLSFFLSCPTGQKERFRIQAKNLLKRARIQMEDAGIDRKLRTNLLDLATDLMAHPDTLRNTHQSLACFVSKRHTSKIDIPYPMQEKCVLENQFHLKPVLPLFLESRFYYVLAVSQHHVNLYHANRFSINEVEVLDMPTSIEEVANLDEPRKNLQRHSGGAGRANMVHGHGRGKDVKELRLLKFLQEIDKAIRPYVKNTPLVIAGMPHLASLYSKIARHTDTVIATMSGNPETFSPGELNHIAWEHVSPKLFEDFKEMHDTLKGAADGWAPKPTAIDFKQILIAAYEGRVEKCMIALEEDWWGHFNPETAEMEFSNEEDPTAVDLVDSVVRQTLAQGGEVFAVDRGNIPGRFPVAALLRY